LRISQLRLFSNFLFVQKNEISQIKSATNLKKILNSDLSKKTRKFNAMCPLPRLVEFNAIFCEFLNCACF
jgi:hypothetical protein